MAFVYEGFDFLGGPTGSTGATGATGVRGATGATGSDRLVAVSKNVLFSDLTGALGTTKTIDFDAPLPAGAVYIGSMAVVDEEFNDIADGSTVTADLGAKSGDTDAYLDGIALGATGSKYTPQGVGASSHVGHIGASGFAGGVTPSIIVNSNGALSTLTKGDATFYVYYQDLTTP